MSQQKPVYQITARHEDGTVSLCSLEGSPLHFGGAPTTDLNLNGENIPAIGGRFVPGGLGRVLVINLAMSAITLNGQAVPLYHPTEWKPGMALTIGRYTLELAPIESKNGAEAEALATLVPPASTASGATGSRQSRRYTSARPAHPPKFDGLERRDDATTLPPIPDDEVPTERPGSLPEMSDVLKPIDPSATADEPAKVWRGLELIDEPQPVVDVSGMTLDEPPRYTPPPTPTPAPIVDIASQPTIEPVIERQPETPAQAKPAPALGMPPVTFADTMLKDWRMEGKLSVQLGMDTLNFVPGERVRVPLSAQNSHSHPVELVAELIGIPREWTVDSPVTQVGAGQTKALDVALQTRPGAVTSTINARVRVHDQLTPEIGIDLPIKLVLKAQPDVVGWLDPAKPSESSPIFLVLQNHTFSPMHVSLSGYSSPEIGLLLPNTYFELAFGQTVRIPLKIEVFKRTWWGRRSYRFGVYVQQGSRAPLDYAGVLRVRSRLWL